MSLTRILPTGFVQKFARFPSRLRRRLSENRLFTYLAVLGPGLIAANAGQEPKQNRGNWPHSPRQRLQRT